MKKLAISAIIILFALIPSTSQAQSHITRYPSANIKIEGSSITRAEAIGVDTTLYFKWYQLKDTIPGIYVLEKKENDTTEILALKEVVCTPVNIELLICENTKFENTNIIYTIKKITYPNSVMEHVNNPEASIHSVILNNKINFIILNKQGNVIQ